jgi:hypothetical protein
MENGYCIECFAEEILNAHTYTKRCIKSNKNLNNGKCYEGVSCKELFKKFNILQLSRKFLLSLLPFIVNNIETFQTQFHYSQ